jgi:hypothetical protein
MKKYLQAHVKNNKLNDGAKLRDYVDYFTVGRIYY